MKIPFYTVIIYYFSGSTASKIRKKNKIKLTNIGKYGPNFYFEKDSNIPQKNKLRTTIKTI